LAHFCRTKYNNVEVVFITHDSVAKISKEEDFFKISSSGGTKCSTAFELALENIRENHPPEVGDNWGDDNIKCIGLVKELLEVCTAVGYGEVDVDSIFRGNGAFSWSTLHDDFEKEIDHPRFMSMKLSKKEDIFTALQKFLGVKEGE